MASNGVSGTRLALVVGVTALVFGGLGVATGHLLTTSSATPQAAGTTTTTVPEAIFLGQERDWLAVHGEDLTLIATWARNLGNAAKAGDGRLATLSADEMLLQVGRADGDLPSNAFGDALHKVFVKYVAALNQIHDGLRHGNQQEFNAGSKELAQAVARFGVITAPLAKAH